MYRILIGILTLALAFLMIFIEVSAYKRRNGNNVDHPKNNLHMMYPPTGSSTQEKE